MSQPAERTGARWAAAEHRLGAVLATLRQIASLQWRVFHPVPALYCVPGIVVILAAGLAAHRVSDAMVAAGGAFSVGFGAFQRFGRWRTAPMLLATLGIAFSMAVGTLASNNPVADALCVALSAFTLGVGTGFGTGAWWVMLQWSVWLIVAGSFPGGLTAAGGRALLLLLGGLVQTGLFKTLWLLLPRGFPRLVPPNARRAPVTGTGWLRAILRGFRLDAAEARYAIALALVAGSANLTGHLLALPNGYWVAMTALLVLRRDTQETVVRSLLRVGGTLVGAGLATLVAELFRPVPPVLICLIGLCAWGAYALQWVNYGVFSASLTAYVAFLFAFGGEPEPAMAAHRVVATLIGGAFGLAGIGVLLAIRRARTG